MGNVIDQSSSGIKVSIILPVHNSEKYLRRCLMSALRQTLRNIEVICIDTGNTDMCFEIISEFQNIDRRVTYIKDINGSYGHKINVGIHVAKGDYIAILESDDQMFPNMLEKLYAMAEECSADLVDADYCQFFDYRGKELFTRCHLYSQPEAYNRLLSHKESMTQNATTNAIWTALYRRAFLLEEDIRLNESPGASYQDVSFAFLTSFCAKWVYHIEIPLYQYRIDNIGSSVKDDKKVFEISEEYNFLKAELEKRNTKTPDAWVAFYTKKYSSYFWNYCRLSEKSRALFLERYLEELRNDVENGAINRAMVNDSILYNQTFLLLDDLSKFKTVAAAVDEHKPIQALCEILDRIGVQEIVVFGAGILGTRVLDILHQNGNNILGLCDNATALHGTVISGLEVRPVAETVRKYPNACYLIVNRKYSEEMKEQLIGVGIGEANIEIFS